MEYRYARMRNVPLSKQERVPFVMPRYFENFHISVKGKCENTFYMSVSRLLRRRHHKYKNISRNEQTLRQDIAFTTK